MVKPRLRKTKYSALERGLLGYLNFSPSEKRELTNYLLGLSEAPVFKPKINANEVAGLRELLKQFKIQSSGPGISDWVASKNDELDFLEEYVKFAKDGKKETFLERIYRHYGALNKALFHFHLNNLVRSASSNKRNKILLQELLGLVAKEIAIDYSKHSEYEISQSVFNKFREIFSGLYEPEIKAIRNSLRKFERYHDYSAKELCSLIDVLLKHYGLDAERWRVLVGKNTEKVSVNRISKEIRVSSNAVRFNKPRMAGLLLHEICVHVVGHSNIDANYKTNKSVSINAVEEGLGVFLEQIVLTKPHHMRVYRYLAIGLALGIDGTPRDMKQVSKILWRLRYLAGQSSSIKLAQEYAIKEVLRVFRGMPATVGGVVSTKDKVYLEGNQYIWSLAKAGQSELIFTGFLGK